MMEAMMQVALQNPTYESDFFAVGQILDAYGRIDVGDGSTYLAYAGNDAYVLVRPGGVRHNHLLREYAIHHLLKYYYACAV